MKEPEFILLYHAIDWLAKIIDEPRPYYEHGSIYGSLADTLKTNSTQEARDLAIEKLNALILSEKISIYAKPFDYIFSQVSNLECNRPNTSLDYPFFELSKNLDSFEKLQKIDIELDIENPINIVSIFSPLNYELIKKCKVSNNELDFLPFSFNSLNEEDRNFYKLDEFGISIREGLDKCGDDDQVALLFLKVEHLRKVTLAETLAKPTEPRGRPKQHYPEISLLFFLSKQCSTV